MGRVGNIPPNSAITKLRKKCVANVGNVYPRDGRIFCQDLRLRDSAVHSLKSPVEFPSRGIPHVHPNGDTLGVGNYSRKFLYWGPIVQNFYHMKCLIVVGSVTQGIIRIC